MAWLEDILDFLRKGPSGGKLDMNALVQGAVDLGQVDKEKCITEINELIKWQEARKKWHQDKTRQKMAAEGTGHGGVSPIPGSSAFKSSDFGLHEVSQSFCCCTSAAFQALLVKSTLALNMRNTFLLECGVLSISGGLFLISLFFSQLS